MRTTPRGSRAGCLRMHHTKHAAHDAGNVSAENPPHKTMMPLHEPLYSARVVQAHEKTSDRGARTLRTTDSVSSDHTQTCQSSETLAMKPPPGLSAIWFTSSECSSSVATTGSASAGGDPEAPRCA